MTLSSAGSWEEGHLILMYHSVDVPPLLHGQRGLYVTPHLLLRQVEELHRQGIPFVSLGTPMEAGSVGRSVSLTFDDAYRNLLVNGLPPLLQQNLSALTYVVTSLMGQTNEWDQGRGARREPLMDRAELADWLAAGQQIGSHGLTHRDLTTLSLEEARREIFDSKARLEDHFGRSIDHFCYPYGAWNEPTKAMVQEAGYVTATSTIPGFNTAETDPFLLRRWLARHRKPWLAALLRH